MHGFLLNYTTRLVQKEEEVKLLYSESHFTSVLQEPFKCNSFESIIELLITTISCNIRLVVLYYRVSPFTKTKLSKSLFLPEFSNYLDKLTSFFLQVS